MINLTSYITEKFRISKTSNYSVTKIESVMTDYLDRMIITDEEKYFINEVISEIDNWIETNDIQKISICYCHYFGPTKFVETQKEMKETIDIEKVEGNSYRKIMPGVANETTKVYEKRMKNQFVKISIKTNDSILYYKDDFVQLIFSKEKLY